MSRLTDEQYAEYYRLLAAWVDAKKIREQTPNPETEEAARGAFAAVNLFRSKHGLDRQVEAPESSGIR